MELEAELGAAGVEAAGDGAAAQLGQGQGRGVNHISRKQEFKQIIILSAHFKIVNRLNFHSCFQRPSKHTIAFKSMSLIN